MEHDRADYYSSYTVTVSRREGQVRMQLIDPVFLTGLLCPYIYRDHAGRRRDYEPLPSPVNLFLPFALCGMQLILMISGIRSA